MYDTGLEQFFKKDMRNCKIFMIDNFRSDIYNKGAIQKVMAK